MVLPVVNLDHTAISGITGSISIACWIIVFTPQLYENFKRQSAEGLSLTFIILWLAGDIFNVIGAILQNVLPTMIILAIYYTLADIVLLIQCVVYNRRAITSAVGTTDGGLTSTQRRRRDQPKVDPSHLSPATPLLYEQHIISYDSSTPSSCSSASSPCESTSPSPSPSRSPSPKPFPAPPPSSTFSVYIYNTVIVLMVLLSGIIGWLFTSHPSSPGGNDGDDSLQFNLLGQIFGWLCAVLYLGSRIPQIMLNFERKSCDGISFLFFLFACLGNLFYVVSILATSLSGQYLLINASWLVGSLGTLGLDLIIFVQFWTYGSSSDESDVCSSDSSSLDI